MYVHHVVECCISSGESTNVQANAVGESNFGREDRNSQVKRELFLPYLSPSLSLAITEPRASKLLLMCPPSFKRWPARNKK